ncbi:hypothetical protein KCP77_21045 [Salmonella enterica subsp. enterica]|nr:hypothetical protein KCP77_21045 [Salmonella enterica subsp. enterica]
MTTTNPSLPTILVRRDSFILRPGEKRKNCVARFRNARTAANETGRMRNFGQIGLAGNLHKIPKPRKNWYSSFVPGKKESAVGGGLRTKPFASITERDAWVRRAGR